MVELRICGIKTLQNLLYCAWSIFAQALFRACPESSDPLLEMVQSSKMKNINTQKRHFVEN